MVQWYIVAGMIELSNSEDLGLVSFGCCVPQKNKYSTGILKPVPVLNQIYIQRLNVKKKIPVSGNTTYKATKFSYWPRLEQDVWSHEKPINNVWIKKTKIPVLCRGLLLVFSWNCVLDCIYLFVHSENIFWEPVSCQIIRLGCGHMLMASGRLTVLSLSLILRT